MNKLEGYKSKHKIRYRKKERKWKNMIWAEILMHSDFSLLILWFQRERGVLLPTSHSRWHSLCGVCVLQEGCTGQPHAPFARRCHVQTSQNGKPLLCSQSLVLQVIRVCPFYRHYLHSRFSLYYFFAHWCKVRGDITLSTRTSVSYPFSPDVIRTAENVAIQSDMTGHHHVLSGTLMFLECNL